MSAEISFKDYLLRNERWLGTEEEQGNHQTDGKLDSSEISVFFSNSHIDIERDYNENIFLTGQKFDDWYSQNESSISSYLETLGLDYDDDSKKALMNSMIDFIDSVDNIDWSTYDSDAVSDSGSLNVSNSAKTRKTQHNINENENLSKIGSFQNKYVNSKNAEEVNADLFDGPVVTLSKYEQEQIMNSGFIDDIEGYTMSKNGNFFSRNNDDGTTDYIRIVNDNGNYKVIHTTTGDNINSTEVLALNRKNISNFTMPENFKGSNKNAVKYDNLGNYHITASSSGNTIADIIKGVYGVSIESEEGKKIYEAILNKNTLLEIEGPSSIIENGKDIILVDKKELDAIEKSKTNGNLFNSDVNVKSEYVNNGETMPYLLLGPENPDPDVEYPVIVYLHGDAQKGKGEDAMYKVQSPGGFMNDIDLDNFNGYILCPQLTGSYYREGWEYSEKNVRDLINNFSQTHNIDSDRIALVGASRGGMGTISLAGKMGDVFCSAAAISGYPTDVQPKDVNIPIRGYVGDKDSPGSISYMKNTFAAQCGAENLITLSNTDHTHGPKSAFGLDEDGDHCSDLVQWLFKDSDTKSTVTPSYFKQSEPVYPQNLTTVDRTPTALEGNIQDVNWEDYGYSAETGRKFAQGAENVESRLIAKGIPTKSNCLGGVKDTFVEVTGENPFVGIGTGAGSASVMENLEGYREITGISVYDLKYLPAGAVVVWSVSTSGDSPASKYGHVSISLGDGRESSATVHPQYTSVGKDGKPRVFIPIE